MLWRLELGTKNGVEDVMGKKAALSVDKALGIKIKDARLVKVYTIEGVENNVAEKIKKEAMLHDTVLQEASLKPYNYDADWVLEVGFRPGVTDNEGRTAKETLAMVLGVPRNKIQVYASNQYHFFSTPEHKITKEEIQKIAEKLFCNELIQRYSLKSKEEWNKTPGFEAKAAQVTGNPSDEVVTIEFSKMNDAELMNFSRSNTLALSLEELKAIKAYYANPEVKEQRKNDRLPLDPTDAEIEVLAQTWSEHCKHKIFSAFIEYEDKENGTKRNINSLYKSCIQNTTKQIRERLGKNDYCRSVFKDNAGVVAFNDDYDLCIKVETHNSPSALDPYGGALTGIVGVNRDPMGTGMGAELICNTDVFCFASPFYKGELPPRLLHPRRVMEGVREGVEHGGNKSGIPTVNGAVVFDERYLGKPLVYCGTIGIMPKTLNGQPGHYKKALVGDAIVMVGGRIGKDGIHGATFSSEELHEGSPATAVQIGDPIVQRKMYDFIIKARNMGLYNAITDNGAGGLSSSVGEMAGDTGGCKLNLANAPLKYDGLKPWEILLSEAQERMTLAVPQTKLKEFLKLAQQMDVEATSLGEFTDSGYFEVSFNDKKVAKLQMAFMHDGVPQLKLKATWEKPKSIDSEMCVKCLTMGKVSHNDLLLNLLGRLNICSKEYMIRQYDHEVKGGSVVKPLVGVKRDAPADAAVVRPVLAETKGMVISNGICPKFSDYDSYWMMANAIDEAVRNAVAVGAKPDQLAGVDNFCWCDPVESERTPDGQYKLAQLVRANEALRDFCLGFSVPCVSGKDSMKNDYMGGGQKISIPPTVLFSVLGIIDDVNKAVTSDFKQADDSIYILGLTKRELAGSEVASELGFKEGVVPEVDLLSAKQRYESLYQAIQKGLVTAAHDLSDGGLGVALAEMAVGGRLGVDVNIALMPCMGCETKGEMLYSESASRLLVSVKPENAKAFEALFAGQYFAKIGKVTKSNFIVKSDMNALINLEVEQLAKAFKQTLNW
ncbi:AIR synthase-related protein [Desulfovibrio litoralis]|uniref:Phosphoribosylformylglycinamidine synthase subunit PurL n=1 Tax=Desulfovibrio litoralis DSM 11393 TaxID=1121455 RepID=A0A1M7T451_9BACT|nr:AIR synthase-related protein [Desulfovibrio litoralis]SHN65525.1 phosphoribosylformylglycinamidine synthase subunit II [Desulfovibrio litoralis DSM 11393]